MSLRASRSRWFAISVMLSYIVARMAEHADRPGVGRTLRSERGQVMMEYILLEIVAVIGLLGFSIWFQDAIHNYLMPVYFFISLPIP